MCLTSDGLYHLMFYMSKTKTNRLVVYTTFFVKNNLSNLLVKFIGFPWNTLKSAC